MVGPARGPLQPGCSRQDQLHQLVDVPHTICSLPPVAPQPLSFIGSRTGGHLLFKPGEDISQQCGTAHWLLPSPGLLVERKEVGALGQPQA